MAITPLRKNHALQERASFSFPWAAVTATAAAQKFGRMIAEFEVEKIEFHSVTGLAQDAANYFVLTVQNGATVVGTWSTLTGAEGSLTANTYKTGRLSTVAGATRLDADDELTLVLTETGVASLPAGTVTVHGHYRTATH